MQRITLTLVLTLATIGGSTALVTSAMQQEHTPLPPELKEAGTPGDPANPHLPLPPEPKEGPGPAGDPNPTAPHIPIPPESKGSPNTPPESIVNINGDELLAAGGAIVTYTVPFDRWLVLTDLEANWQTISGTAVLSERLGAAVTDKRTGFLNIPFHSFTGIAFQPGSQVILREVSLHGSVNVAFSFSGFLVKP